MEQDQVKTRVETGNPLELLHAPMSSPTDAAHVVSNEVAISPLSISNIRSQVAELLESLGHKPFVSTIAATYLVYEVARREDVLGKDLDFVLPTTLQISDSLSPHLPAIVYTSPVDIKNTLSILADVRRSFNPDNQDATELCEVRQMILQLCQDASDCWARASGKGLYFLGDTLLPELKVLSQAIHELRYKFIAVEGDADRLRALILVFSDEQYSLDSIRGAGRYSPIIEEWRAQESLLRSQLEGDHVDKLYFSRVKRDASWKQREVKRQMDQWLRENVEAPVAERWSELGSTMRMFIGTLDNLSMTKLGPELALGSFAERLQTLYRLFLPELHDERGLTESGFDSLPNLLKKVHAEGTFVLSRLESAIRNRTQQ